MAIYKWRIRSNLLESKPLVPTLWPPAGCAASRKQQIFPGSGEYPIALMEKSIFLNIVAEDINGRQEVPRV
jgi:hypothetical protein